MISECRCCINWSGFNFVNRLGKLGKLGQLHRVKAYWYEFWKNIIKKANEVFVLICSSFRLSLPCQFQQEGISVRSEEWWPTNIINSVNKTKLSFCAMVLKKYQMIMAKVVFRKVPRICELDPVFLASLRIHVTYL